MTSRKKTIDALRRHVVASEQESLKARMKQAGLPEDVQVAGAVPKSADDDGGFSPSGTMRRQIPKEYDYDPRALKPLARMLWTLSISLGHAMTAHRTFCKLKSATISPDGLIGGRGYVMSVKDVRAALHDACEAISSVSDTIHDELHAPHWRPKLAELESQDIESVERLVGNAERVLENPEDESFVQDGLNQAESEGEQAELEQDEVGNPESDERFTSGPEGVPEGLEGEDSESEDDEDEEEDEDEDDEDEDEESDASEMPDAEDMVDSESSKVKTASVANNLFWRIANRFANSSLPVETMSGGPRVEHLDRGDDDKTGPFGSQNSDEPQSMEDDWSKDNGVGNRYNYESEWDNNLLDKSADSNLPGNNTDPTQTQAWDFGIGYGAGDDAHGQGAGGYGPKDSDGKGVYGPYSKMPSDPGGKLHDDDSDSTPAIEMEMGQSNRHACCAESNLPNDGQPGVARSDYYRGDKGSNPVNVGPSNVGSSHMPGQAMPAKPTPATPRPAHHHEHMFSNSELPSEAEASYDYSMDVQPGVGYRYERNQPYVKWDHSTHNMRPDNLSQRDDEGPYVKQEG